MAFYNHFCLSWVGIKCFCEYKPLTEAVPPSPSLDFISKFFWPFQLPRHGSYLCVWENWLTLDMTFFLSCCAHEAAWRQSTFSTKMTCCGLLDTALGIASQSMDVVFGRIVIIEFQWSRVLCGFYEQGGCVILPFILLMYLLFGIDFYLCFRWRNETLGYWYKDVTHLVNVKYMTLNSTQLPLLHVHWCHQ